MTSEADAIREFNEKANADEANANALKKLCKGTDFTIYPQQLSEPGKPCSPDGVADALAYIREITKARIQ
jgi:hypothetical protein